MLQPSESNPIQPFEYLVDRFADLQVLRFRVPGFEALPLETKTLLFHLSEAALAGRDITWDQNYRHNLTLRRCFEALLQHVPSEQQREDWPQFLIYTKRVWFSNGIHHHYSNQKFVAEFSFASFSHWVRLCPEEALPLRPNQTVDAFLDWIQPIIFDPKIDSKRVNKDAGVDLVLGSCVNFYEGLSEKEVQDYYASREEKDNPEPPSLGLNSKLVKDADGSIKEHIWREDGLYGSAIKKINFHLEQAIPFAQSPEQAESLRLLIEYYRTGELKTFDAFSIAWLKSHCDVDMIHGFIETYSDPLDYRGTYEAIISVKDPIATERMRLVATNAQWFENHSPIAEPHKKAEVMGISGSVINVVTSAGDASPTSPIGVNLPNADWIRKTYGSKSVNLANVVEAHNQMKGKMLEEFTAEPELIARAHQFGDLASDLHTDLHEVIGHGSGQLLPGVATPKETLRNYSSTLEEARADLVALYYMLDPYLIEIGLMPSLEVGKASYDDFLVNGLLFQLRRLGPGEQLEEDHMRNRQLIARWVLEKGPDVVELFKRDGKTYVAIHDYPKLRQLFGALLKEVQRIKSEGDFEAGKNLVEGYGVQVDPRLHAEVCERFKALNMAAYTGFQNPVLKPRMDADGKISDVLLDYGGDFVARMMYYAKFYSFLPSVS